MMIDPSLLDYGNDPLFKLAINSMAPSSTKKTGQDDFSAAIPRDTAAMYSSKLQSPRVKANESFSVKVYDNWLDPKAELPNANPLSNRVGVS